MIPIEKVQDTETCYIQFWILLEHTRKILRDHYKRYCIRNILKYWFGPAATDDFIFEVCNKCCLEGMTELRMPECEPRPHRELIRATVATVLNKGINHLNLQALDHAYRIVYPDGLSLNVNKK